MDIQTILWGVFILGIAIGAFLFIKSKLRPPMNYREYKEELRQGFMRRGFSYEYINGLSDRQFEEYFHEGLDSEEAINQYLM